MFARKIRIEYESESGRQPIPMKWLDNFAMRNFTNDPIFDETLPSADGVMEVGARVPLNRLREAMQDWFQRKGYLPKEGRLIVEEIRS